MFATLLPGIRHVRTPLITGYLYFLVAWMLLGPDRLTPHAGGGTVAERRLSALVQEVGSGPTFAALSFAALLIGSLATISRWDKWPLVWKPGHNENPYDAAQTRGERVWSLGWPGLLESWAFNSTDWLNRDRRPTWREFMNSDQLPEGFKSAVESRHNTEEQERWEREEVDEAERESFFERVHSEAFLNDPIASWPLRIEFQGAVIGEFNLLAARAQVDSPAIYSEYDRYSAEAELRFSIVPPLILLVGVAAATWHWWAIVGLLLPAALLYKGLNAQNEATSLIARSVVYGSLPSPIANALAAFRNEWTRS